MPKQPTIPSLRDAVKKKAKWREMFLTEMGAVVPWVRLLALVEPHYPKVGPKGGRPPMPLEMMLGIYFLQSWYALSDPMAEESLYDSEAIRRFAEIELGDDRIPDETTILKLRDGMPLQLTCTIGSEPVGGQLRVGFKKQKSRENDRTVSPPIKGCNQYGGKSGTEFSCSDDQHGYYRRDECVFQNQHHYSAGNGCWTRQAPGEGLQHRGLP